MGAVDGEDSGMDLEALQARNAQLHKVLCDLRHAAEAVSASDADVAAAREAMAMDEAILSDLRGKLNDKRAHIHELNLAIGELNSETDEKMAEVRAIEESLLSRQDLSPSIRALVTRRREKWNELRSLEVQYDRLQAQLCDADEEDTPLASPPVALPCLSDRSLLAARERRKQAAGGVQPY